MINKKISNIAYALPVLFGVLFTTHIYALEGKSDFIKRLSTETEFESIPHYLKLKSALETLSGRSGYSALSNEDNIVATEAITTKPSSDRTANVFTDTCFWLAEKKAAGNMIDASHIGRQQALAEQMETEGIAARFYVAYDRLSVDGQSLVDEKIQRMRGSNRLTVIFFDFEGYAKFAPEETVSQFASYCEKLDK
jgi:hypothetical protein